EARRRVETGRCREDAGMAADASQPGESAGSDAAAAEDGAEGFHRGDEGGAREVLAADRRNRLRRGSPPGFLQGRHLLSAGAEVPVEAALGMEAPEHTAGGGCGEPEGGRDPAVADRRQDVAGRSGAEALFAAGNQGRAASQREG